MTLLSEIYNVTLKRNNRGANTLGWIRPTIGEFFMTHKDFKHVENNVVRVGPDKEFTTINSAIASSKVEHGYTILVDYGTYSGTHYIGKGVNIRGIPNSSGIMPTITGTTNYALYLGNAGGRTVTIEGFVIKGGHDSWTTCIRLGSGSYGVLRLNKCYIGAYSTSTYPIGRDDSNTGASSRFTVTNCNFSLGYTRVRKLISGVDTINKSTYSGDTGTGGEEWNERLGTGTIAVDGVHVRKLSLGIEGYGVPYGEYLIDV